MAYDSACILSFKTSLIFDTNRGFRFWQTCRFVCIYWRYALWVLCKFEVNLYVCVESVPIVNQMEQLKDWVTYLVDCSGYPFCCCKQQLSHNTWRFSNVSHDITSWNTLQVMQLSLFCRFIWIRPKWLNSFCKVRWRGHWYERILMNNTKWYQALSVNWKIITFL
jgi:hypothetical protein